VVWTNRRKQFCRRKHRHIQQSSEWHCRNLPIGNPGFSGPPRRRSPADLERGYRRPDRNPARRPREKCSLREGQPGRASNRVLCQRRHDPDLAGPGRMAGAVVRQAHCQHEPSPVERMGVARYRLHAAVPWATDPRRLIFLEANASCVTQSRGQPSPHGHLSRCSRDTVDVGQGAH
jgi:hypothetical protein